MVTQKEKLLYFLVKYNWETRDTKYAPYDERGAYLYDEVGLNDTIHRCKVTISATPDGPAEIWSEELYNETDKLDYKTITVKDVMDRINQYRIFPVLPAPGLIMSTRYYKCEATEAAIVVEFGGREFVVSVKEIIPVDASKDP